VRSAAGSLIEDSNAGCRDHRHCGDRRRVPRPMAHTRGAGVYKRCGLRSESSHKLAPCPCARSSYVWSVAATCPRPPGPNNLAQFDFGRMFVDSPEGLHGEWFSIGIDPTSCISSPLRRDFLTVGFRPVKKRIWARVQTPAKACARREGLSSTTVL
jgi:hypothetical protein